MTITSCFMLDQRFVFWTRIDLLVIFYSASSWLDMSNSSVSWLVIAIFPLFVKGKPTEAGLN